MDAPEPGSYRQLIAAAREEDLGCGDITSEATIPAEMQGVGELVFHEEGVLCGLGVAGEVLRQYDEKSALSEMIADGDTVAAGQVVATVTGSVRSLLAAERVMLNFLQRLSGVATNTAAYVKAVSGTKAQIYDTRKTTPGWRELEKYAVRCGGGCNHRMGLYDAVMVKDNHLAAMGTGDWQDRLAAAVAKIRNGKQQPDFVEVEVDGLDQLQAVLKIEGVDRILLDNMTGEEMSRAVRLRDESGKAKVKLEASGGIRLATVREAALSGVDIISVGALTHTVRSLDIGFNLRQQ